MGYRLTQQEWGEIRTIWESGSSTPKQIAWEYGINIKTLRNKASMCKWGKCGSAVREALEEARKEYVSETKESFKMKAEEANRRHTEIFCEIQSLGRICHSLLFKKLTHAMNGDKTGLEEIQSVIDNIKLRRLTFCASSITNMLKEGINGERRVLGLDGMDPDDWENSLDQLSEAIDRARMDRGIINVSVG